MPVNPSGAQTNVQFIDASGNVIMTVKRFFGADAVRGLTADERHEADMRILAEKGSYQWTEVVPNPEFDRSQPSGESNPETIPNPYTFWEYAAFNLGKAGEDIVTSELRRQSLRASRAQINAAVQSSNDTAVTIVEK